MKKLYKVEVSGCVYVYADSLEQVEEDAKCGVKITEYEFLDYEIHLADAKTIKEDKWDNCIPYGEHDDQTCLDLFFEVNNENPI